MLTRNEYTTMQARLERIRKAYIELEAALEKGQEYACRVHLDGLSDIILDNHNLYGGYSNLQDAIFGIIEEQNWLDDNWNNEDGE